MNIIVHPEKVLVCTWFLMISNESWSHLLAIRLKNHYWGMLHGDNSSFSAYLTHWYQEYIGRLMETHRFFSLILSTSLDFLRLKRSPTLWTATTPWRDGWSWSIRRLQAVETKGCKQTLKTGQTHQFLFCIFSRKLLHFSRYYCNNIYFQEPIIGKNSRRQVNISLTVTSGSTQLFSGVRIGRANH